MCQADDSVKGEGPSPEEALQSGEFAEAVSSAPMSVEEIVIACLDECSDKMHEYLGAGDDARAEVYRCRFEGVSRVAQKLGFFGDPDEWKPNAKITKMYQDYAEIKSAKAR